MTGKVTLSEIAKRAETNTMAVSVVLNGSRSNTRVSAATRQRIVEIAAELKYSPNAMARSLKRQRSNTLGILFNWAGTQTIHNLFSMAVLDGVVAGAAAAGYHILLYTEGWKNAAVSSAAFSDQRADGVILVTPADDSDVVPSLIRLGVPLSLLSSSTDIPGIPFANIDNRKGITLALDHLGELGHTRIAYVSHELMRYNMRERHATYCEWMKRHGLPVRDEYVRVGINMSNDEIRREQFKMLLSLPEPPTAVIAAMDDLAVELMEVARNLGIAVPRELSVVGFDDLLAASLSVPKLTTVRQPLYEMGRQAAFMLIERIEEKGEAARIATGQIMVPELVVRASTAPPLPLLT